jgi:hypothetical protein
MKINPIVNGIRESYYKHGLETERAVFAMLMTKAVKDQVSMDDISNINIGEISKAIHNASMRSACLNFQDGELILQDNYEIHSVSACRDDDGDPEVFIHMYEIESGETHSVRIYQFPQLDWLLQIIEVVNNKCELTFNTDEDEED